MPLNLLFDGSSTDQAINLIQKITLTRTTSPYAYDDLRQNLKNSYLSRQQID